MRIAIWILVSVISAIAYNEMSQWEEQPREVTMKEAFPLDFEMEKMYALDYLNELREAVGLVEFSSSSLLEKSAENHANYLIENSAISHYETSSKVGFTGESIGDRAKAVGYKASYVSENLSGGSRGYKHSLDGLFSAIYHRFGFLDFKIDEIGIGINQDSKQRDKTLFIYNMGSHKLNKLCEGESFSGYGKYVVGVCFEREFKIKEKEFKNAFARNKSKIVIYPYDGQTDVPPAFFEETPDPLPRHDVSGFPISISFNEEQFSSLEVTSFKLFDSNNREITNTLLYDHKSDIHHRFKKFEFALFPLERLEWNSMYRVRVGYFVDGVKKEKQWSFTTRTFREKLHTVTTNNYRFKIKKNITEIFYFKPLDERDILEDLEYPLSVDVTIVDNNTIKFTAFDDAPDEVELKFGKHKLVVMLIK